MEQNADVAIVGAGVVGLAHAYLALKKGLKVVLFEREQFAIGASVRNFGLLWPIGQGNEKDVERAIRSRAHWSTLASEANFWINANGSLHLAYHDDEMEVLTEFMSAQEKSQFKLQMLTPAQVVERSPIANSENLKGGMWSETEATVYSREAIRRIPLFLQERYGLVLRFGEMVEAVQMPWVETTREKWKVQKTIVCSGADFQTLYPEVFDRHQIVKCKLQMMRGVTREPLTMGPSLCAGLTLLHYQAFANCESLKKVKDRYAEQLPFCKKYGIHVLLAQNALGEFIIGDSHEYGQTVEPFDQESINDAILNYMNTFVSIPGLSIVERWNGIYPKLLSANHLIISPEEDVMIVNGLGGAGMTMSFGIAEEIINAL